MPFERVSGTALPDGRKVLILQVKLFEVGQVLDARRHVTKHAIVVQVEVADTRGVNGW